jgi:hypothetical protein
MKYAILFLGCFAAFLSGAQTAIIAHKSHSGTTADFFTDPSTNFGIPSRKLQQVVYLNDSTVIHVYSRFGEDIEYDTIHSRTSYSLNIDSVKQQAPYLRKVEYVHFKHSADSSKIKKRPSGTYAVPEIPEPVQAEPQQDVNQKKKKKSYLLFLFGITGGGLLAFRSMGKLFTPRTVS